MSVSGPRHGSYKHGETNSVEFRIWSGMKERCLNPKGRAFAHYGGRGITVDPSWLDFRNFLQDMGRRPPPQENGMNYTLERVDNDKGYSKANCVWATQKQQANNRRKWR